MPKETPRQQLARFLGKYDRAIAASARAALTRLRQRIPGAQVLVYDNYNALAVGFGPSERASEAVLSIAVYPRWVTLFFLKGARLPDAKKILKGSGSRVRHVVLENPAHLESPEVQRLIAAALDAARPPIDPAAPGKLIIKSISAKQRPRRVATRSSRS